MIRKKIVGVNLCDDNSLCKFRSLFSSGVDLLISSPLSSQFLIHSIILQAISLHPSTTLKNSCSYFTYHYQQHLCKQSLLASHSVSHFCVSDPPCYVCLSSHTHLHTYIIWLCTSSNRKFLLYSFPQSLQILGFMIRFNTIHSICPSS